MPDTIPLPDDIVAMPQINTHRPNVAYRTVARWAARGMLTRYRRGSGGGPIMVSLAEVDALVAVRPETVVVESASADSVARYIAGVVESAPPLSDEQRDRLRSLLAVGVR